MSDYRPESNRPDANRDDEAQVFTPGPDALETIRTIEAVEALEAIEAMEEAELAAMAAPTRPADRIRAKADEVVGRAEAAVGARFGEPAARKVRQGGETIIYRTEDALESAKLRLDRELVQRPYQTLGVAAGVGLVVGLWLARR